MLRSYACASLRTGTCRLTNAYCIVNLGTLKPSSHIVQVARYLGVVDRCVHNANSKHRILSVCRMYLAKEAQTGSFSKFCRYLTLMEQPESGELVFFVPIDRQTDRHHCCLVLVKCLGGLLFGGRCFCTKDSFAGHSGLYCGDFLAVSILVCM